MEDVLGSCPLAPSPLVLSELVLYNSAEIRTASMKLHIISAQINNEEKALLCKAGKQPISTMLATSHLAGRPVRTEVWRCSLAVGPLECLHTHSEENLGCDLLCICHIGCWTSAHTSRPEERITVQWWWVLQLLYTLLQLKMAEELLAGWIQPNKQHTKRTYAAGTLVWLEHKYICIFVNLIPRSRSAPKMQCAWSLWSLNAGSNQDVSVPCLLLDSWDRGHWKSLHTTFWL